MDYRDDYDFRYWWAEFEKSQKCPNDGEQMTYWEGTIDQDRQGNDIRGWNFYCPKCGHETEVEEF